jgi:hypothetical protein
MLAEDIEAGKGQLKLRQTDPKHFKIGENIATTPGKVIHQNDICQIVQYAQSTDSVLKRPLADRSAVDQQVLHPRSRPGKVADPLARSTRGTPSSWSPG